MKKMMRSTFGRLFNENWEIVSCTGGEMVNKALHRRTDGSTYTITAHLKKVE